MIKAGLFLDNEVFFPLSQQQSKKQSKSMKFDVDFKKADYRKKKFSIVQQNIKEKNLQVEDFNAGGAAGNLSNRTSKEKIRVGTSLFEPSERDLPNSPRKPLLNIKSNQVEELDDQNWYSQELGEE